MAKGTIKVATSNEYINGTITWSSAPNYSNNTSDVTATLKLSKSSKSTSPTWGAGSFSLTINGSSKTITRDSSNKFVFEPGKTYTIATHTVKGIKHNSDGKKSITIKATGNIPGTTMNGGANSSGTAVLDNIPVMTGHRHDGSKHVKLKKGSRHTGTGWTKLTIMAKHDGTRWVHMLPR